MTQPVSSFPDLFPETLLVSVQGTRTYTSSLKVAAHFHKQHKNVLQSIEKLRTSKAGWRLNFQPRDYKDGRGKTHLAYDMDLEAFSILAMGFTGEKALVWKLDFYDAFAQMANHIYLTSNRRAHALGVLRPNYIIIEDADAQGLPRSAIAAKTGHASLGSITANRKRMRALGLAAKPLAAKKGG